MKRTKRRSKVAARTPGFGHDKTHGVWYMRVTLPNGKRPRVTEPDTTPESEARVILQNKIARFTTARRAVDGMQPISYFIDVWANLPQHAPRTRQNYRGYAKKKCVIEFGKITTLRVQPDDIDECLKQIPQDYTRGKVRTFLHTVFEYVILKKILPVGSNPVQATLPVKYVPVKRDTTFDYEDLPYLFTAAAQPQFARYRAMVPLGLYGSLGIAELGGLQIGDYNRAACELAVERNVVTAKGSDEDKYSPKVGPVKVPGGDRERVIELPPIAIEWLDDLLALKVRERIERDGKRAVIGQPLDPREHLFPSPEGGLLDYHNFADRVWKPLMEAAAAEAAKDGRTFPTHLGTNAMRHTFREIGSEVELGYDLTSKTMGHKRLSTTFENYNKKIWKRRRQVGAAKLQAFHEGVVGVRESA